MEQMKVVYKVILFWNQNQEVPTDYITQGGHKNVVVQSDPINLPVPDAVKKAIASLDVYKDTLREVLGKGEFNERFLKTVMQQVSHGVDHLHKCGKLFGPLTQDQVYICCCRTEDVSIVLHNPSPESHSEDDAEGKKRDIKGLAKFFCELLTNSKVSNPDQIQKGDVSCSDKGVALHLIEMMYRDRPTRSVSAQLVLDHPFFWSNNQKITFICECFDRVKHIQQNMSTIDKHATGTDVFGDNWINCLELEKAEKTDIERELKEMSKRTNIGGGKQKLQVNKQTIRELAMREFKHDSVPYICDDANGVRKFNPSEVTDWTKLMEKMESGCTVPISAMQEHPDGKQVGPILLVKTQQPPYQKDSLFELLRFFRNRRAHYWEGKKNVRDCLSPYPDGFWRFFSSRFPNLLPFVYENEDKCFRNSA